MILRMMCMEILKFWKNVKSDRHNRKNCFISECYTVFDFKLIFPTQLTVPNVQDLIDKGILTPVDSIKLYK